MNLRVSEVFSSNTYMNYKEEILKKKKSKNNKEYNFMDELKKYENEKKKN
ncbi:MAG: hypothetical protein ACRCW0_08365 [Clostridium sp.]